MKASEIIRRLQMMIIQYGDQELYSGGEDYPGPVTKVVFVRMGYGYVPAGSFRLYGGI